MPPSNFKSCVSGWLRNIFSEQGFIGAAGLSIALMLFICTGALALEVYTHFFGSFK